MAAFDRMSGMSGPTNTVIEFPRPFFLDAGQRVPCILLVNDHHDIRHLLVKILQRAGYSNILAAANGAEALDRLREDAVELVITDIHMPQLDGWRLARMVRSGLYACPAAAPIIVASATLSERIVETTAREYENNRYYSLPHKK